MTSEDSSSAPWLAAAAVLKRLSDSTNGPRTNGGSRTADTATAKTLSTRGSFVVSSPPTTNVEISVPPYEDAIGLQLTTASGHVTALLSATDAEALAEQLQVAATEYSTGKVGDESWP